MVRPYAGERSTSYRAKHMRLRRARGKAADQPECEGCGGEPQDWSQIKGTDGMSPEDYRAFCRSCHAKYDSPTGSDHHRSKLTHEQREEVIRRINRRENYRLIAADYSLHISSIDRIAAQQKRR